LRTLFYAVGGAPVEFFSDASHEGFHFALDSIGISDMSRLTKEQQKTLWEVIVAGLLLFVFLVVATVALWPLGKMELVLQLAKGYALFWVVLSFTWWVLSLLQRILRIESDPPSSAYVFTNLGLSAFVQAGWSAFAALAVTGVAAGAPFLFLATPV